MTFDINFIIMIYIILIVLLYIYKNQLFKLNGRIKKGKQGVKSSKKPIIDEENSSKSNKLKKELMKKVKDYQKNKEVEKVKEDKIRDKKDE